MVFLTNCITKSKFDVLPIYFYIYYVVIKGSRIGDLEMKKDGSQQ
jgi:hypothetical protein